jgi:hypothetical protein
MKKNGRCTWLLIACVFALLIVWISLGYFVAVMCYDFGIVILFVFRNKMPWRGFRNEFYYWSYLVIVAFLLHSHTLPLVVSSQAR